jgi:hypothetical protein
MGVETIPDTDIKYGLIRFDRNGVERDDAAKPTSALILERAANEAITDVFFFCHGWKGDMPAARDQYNRWMGALMRSPGLQRASTVFPGFNPLLVGLHWPSQPWGDEKSGGTGESFGDAAGQSPAQMLDAMLAVLGDEPAIRAPLEIIISETRRNAAASELPPAMRRAYLDLNKALGLESKGVEAAPDADREGFDPDELVADSEGENFGDFNLGGVLGPLRQLSYWTMKKRARSIGEGGMHSFLTKLQAATGARRTRIHLMGHSFGTIVISSMIGGPDARAPLSRPIDSVTLVQGAVSLWCFAAKIPFGSGGNGYFNHILNDQKVKGPIVVTRSKYDKAVGVLYPFASRINGSASFDLANAFPEYGAIGAFGIQGTNQGTDGKLLPVGGQYEFAKQRIYNLESSQFICKGDGVSGAHSDIDGQEVAHLIWETAFASQ